MRRYAFYRLLTYGIIHDMTQEEVDIQLNNPKKSVIEGYLELQQRFEEIYGKHTVVVMEVGSFFEVYGVENDTEVIGKPREIADVLNIQLTKKNKSIKENNAKNPLLAGFPTATFDRYISRLVQEKKYTLVIIRQKGIPPNVTRYIDNIISPGINIDYCLDHNDNFICSILIDEHHGVYSVGYAATDVTTGKTYVFEGHGTKEDKTAALDNLFRLLQSHNTAEIVLTLGSETIDRKTLLDYLELGEFEQIHVREKRLPVQYQNELFKKAYTIESFLSPIEFLDIEKQPLTSEALAHLLEFIVDHDFNIIEQLKKPTLIDASNYLYLGNNPLEQLNIISRDPQELTLLRLFDNTTTSIGGRLFKERITNPITNTEELTRRYNLSDWLAPIYKEVDVQLRKVYDLERIARRIKLGRLHPFEINFLYDSLLAAQEIITIVSSQNNPHILPNVVSESNGLNDLISYLKKTFSLSETSKVTRHTIQASLFQQGIHAELDMLTKRLALAEEKLEMIRMHFVKIINEATGKEQDQLVHVKQLDKEGHYISLTKGRYGLIEQEIKETFISLDGTVYALSDFSYKVQTSNVKITANIIDIISEEIVVVQAKIAGLVRELFKEQLAFIDKTFSHVLDTHTESLANIDVAISNVKTAIQRNLCRPEIIETAADESYLSCIDLRHPLVEAKEDHGIFVPNTVVLGASTYNGDDEKKSIMAEQADGSARGLLLYGINSSGKSSLMKSLGVAVLLAQSGSYVPATRMRFSIFKELFTRVIAKDNFEKGLSSFAVEMIELKNIFNRCSAKSLVLGDEISRGTETYSAIAIVAATIKKLIEKKSLFLFTTHLHQIQSLDVLKDVKHLADAHLSIHYDKDGDKLIFDRILKPGSGSSIYGLEFAQSLHLDAAFLKDAMDIRKQLTNDYTDTELLTQKHKSKYNKDIYLTSCAICKSTVEDVHHIEPQKLANKHGHIKHFHKDHKYNLVPICKECHHKIHEGSIVVSGYKMTSKGIQLDIEKK